MRQKSQRVSHIGPRMMASDLHRSKENGKSATERICNAMVNVRKLRVTPPKLPKSPKPPKSPEPPGPPEATKHNALVRDYVRDGISQICSVTHVSTLTRIRGGVVPGINAYRARDIPKFLVSALDGIGQYPRRLATFSYYECSPTLIAREVVDLTHSKLGPGGRVCCIAAPDLVLTETVGVDIQIMLLNTTVDRHLGGRRNLLSRRGGEPVDYDLSFTNLAGLAV